MGIKRTAFIRRIDLGSVKSFHKNKVLNKLQKTEVLTFPLYFEAKSFVKCISNSGRLNMLQS